jgi:hypothetical protein
MQRIQLQRLTPLRLRPVAAYGTVRAAAAPRRATGRARNGPLSGELHLQSMQSAFTALQTRVSRLESCQRAAPARGRIAVYAQMGPGTADLIARMACTYAGVQSAEVQTALMYIVPAKQQRGQQQQQQQQPWLPGPPPGPGPHPAGYPPPPPGRSSSTYMEAVASSNVAMYQVTFPSETHAASVLEHKHRLKGHPLYSNLRVDYWLTPAENGCRRQQKALETLLYKEGLTPRFCGPVLMARVQGQWRLAALDPAVKAKAVAKGVAVPSSAVALAQAYGTWLGERQHPGQSPLHPAHMLEWQRYHRPLLSNTAAAPPTAAAVAPRGWGPGGSGVGGLAGSTNGPRAGAPRVACPSGAGPHRAGPSGLTGRLVVTPATATPPQPPPPPPPPPPAARADADREAVVAFITATIFEGVRKAARDRREAQLAAEQRAAAAEQQAATQLAAEQRAAAAEQQAAAQRAAEQRTTAAEQQAAAAEQRAAAAELQAAQRVAEAEERAAAAAQRVAEAEERVAAAQQLATAARAQRVCGAPAERRAGQRGSPPKPTKGSSIRATGGVPLQTTTRSRLAAQQGARGGSVHGAGGGGTAATRLPVRPLAAAGAGGGASGPAATAAGGGNSGGRAPAAAAAAPGAASEPGA